MIDESNPYEVLGALQDKKNLLRQVEQEIEHLETLLINFGSDKWEFYRDDVAYVATVVKSSTTKIDLAKLATYNESLHDEVTDVSRKLNAEKFEMAIKAGQIPVEQLEEIITYQPRKPYLRFDKAQQPQQEEE